MGFKRTPGSHPDRYLPASAFLGKALKRSRQLDASLLQGADARRRAPGQLGKITLPFRLTGNKTRQAIAVFRARPTNE